MRSRLALGATTILLSLLSLILLELALLTAGVHADGPIGPDSPPALPFSPYGTVQVEKSSVPDGTVIAATCRNVTVRATKTQTYEGQSWYWNLDIPGDDDQTQEIDGCAPGDIITFFINGEIAAQEVEWVSGFSPRLDLTDAKSTAVDLVAFEGGSPLPIGGVLLGIVASLVIIFIGSKHMRNLTLCVVFAVLLLAGPTSVAAQAADPACDLVARASFSCRDEAVYVDWFVSGQGDITIGLNGGARRYGPFSATGYAYGNIWTAFLGRADSIQFYQNGTLAQSLLTYKNCYDVFPEENPNLRLSHVCTTAGETEIHFIINELPPSVADYGSVVFSGVLDDKPLIDMVALFEKRTGNTAHYTLVLDQVASSMVIAVGSVTIDGTYAALANPGPVTIASCETNAINLSGFSARSGLHLQGIALLVVILLSLLCWQWEREHRHPRRER